MFANYRLSIIFFCVLISQNAFSNEHDTESDTLRIYRLGDINIVSGRQVGSIVSSTLNEIRYYEIQRSDIISASEIQRFIPSGRIRTNSRGESMLFIRGAGERQLGLFFDGVPMNLPWDNRFDMSFLPAGIIGKIKVNQNSSSVMYGPNVLGGAVNISTIERNNDGYGFKTKLQASLNETYNIDLTHDARIGSFNYIANLSYLTSNGFTLSGNAPDDLLHQDLNSNFRTNSDQKRLTAYLRGEYDFSSMTVGGISFMLINGEKGVAPESHLENARFWRYPDWNRLLIASNIEHKFTKSESSVLRATLWFDNFSQTINTYSDIAFDKVSSTQLDKDNTVGARLAYYQQLSESQSLTFVMNGFTTKHEEIIDDSAPSDFSQNTINTGIQYNMNISDFNIGAGLAYDYNESPKTGIFQQYAGLSSNDYAAFINIAYNISSDLFISANLSRRTRFPTMRESFSGALNRFKVNPDLRGESGLLSELAVGYSLSNITLRIVGFANFYDDLISQVTLSREQDSLRRRQRVNIGKAEIIGAEIGLNWEINRAFNLHGSLTYMRAKGENDGSKIEYLDNKPELLAGFSINYNHISGLSLLAETETTGNQYEADNNLPDGFYKIDPTTILNFRIAYNLINLTKHNIEIYIRANNIFDTYRLSQRGLPEPGRIIQSGISFNI